MDRRTKLMAIIACAVACGVFQAGPARADGDPASDVLLGQDIFFPYGTKPDATSAALTKEVAQIVAAGDRVKVAVIARRVDLGTIPSLLGKPNAYAGFLGVEIGQYYTGTLLVVMPSGLGLYDGGRSTKAKRRLLAAIRAPGSSRGALLNAALDAVRTLKKAKALHWKDVSPPKVVQRFTPATAGKVVTLQYFVYDDSGRSSVDITILAGDKKLATIRRPLASLAESKPHTGGPRLPKPLTSTWQAPDPLPPDLRYCVVATDPSGNRNQPACLWLQVHG